MQRISMTDLANPCLIRICLSAATHRLLTADEAGYRYVQDDTVHPFETHLDGESRKAFAEALDRGSSDWIPVVFQQEDQRIPMLLRTKENRAAGSLLLTLADPILLVRNIEVRDEQRDYLRMIHTLYDDTWWTWDPGEKLFRIDAAVSSHLPSGLYPEAEAEALVFSFLPREEGEKLLSFFRGLSKTPAAGEIQFQDTSGNRFLLSAVPGLGRSGTECLAGCLHRFRERGKEAPSGPGSALDPLTGVLTRTGIERAACERIQNGIRITLIILDIDFFKTINDRYGHQKGDEVLRCTAECIRKAVGYAGKVGRLGGDEFLIVLDALSAEDGIRGVLRDVRNSVGARYPDTGMGGNPVVTVSMGGAKFPDDAADFSSLFNLADACLYRAKEKGRNRYILYTPEKHGTPEAFIATVLKKQQFATDRPGTNPAEVLISMAYEVRYGTKPELLPLLQRYVRAMGIPCAAILSGAPAAVTRQAGEGASLPAKSLEEAVALLAPLLPRESPDPLVINRMDEGPSGRTLLALGFDSILLYRIGQSSGTGAWLLFYTAGAVHQWNRLRFPSHRLFADLLSLYDLARE